MKPFKFEIFPGGYINCLEDECNCSLTRDCANHTTAGDFRTEDGGSPAIKFSGKELVCGRRFKRYAGAVKLGIVLCQK